MQLHVSCAGHGLPYHAVHVWGSLLFTAQVTIANPTLDCGRVPISLSVNAASSLPAGWVLRTCVPLVVTVVGGPCTVTQVAETSWKLVRPSDQRILLTGAGAGTSTLEYCGPVDEQLQFVVMDTGGARALRLHHSVPSARSRFCSCESSLPLKKNYSHGLLPFNMHAVWCGWCDQAMDCAVEACAGATE